MTDRRRAALILALIAVTEGVWLVANVRASPTRFLAWIGVGGAGAPPLGWMSATVVALAFVSYGAHRFPSVRQTLFVASPLKGLALTVALASGFCEEAIFRKALMDGLMRAHHGLVVQVLASALAFGMIHGVWGAFRGSAVAAVGATLATGVLGLALALVYLASTRDLVPCIVAHGFINALVEPGLVLAAVRGEMSAPRGATRSLASRDDEG